MSNYPGFLVGSAAMTLMGAMIGARSGVDTAFYGAALTGLICWTPVLITARTKPLPEDDDNREESER